MRRHAFFLYCLSLTVLALLITEFVLLPRLHGLPRATLLNGFAAVPGQLVDGQRINRLGFTGDEISEEKPANTIRVLVLGSSTMFNRQMAARLKAALQHKTNRRIELLDAGIRSHTSRADLLKWQLLAGYQWDYVLLYDGINDLWANHVLPADFRADYGHLDPWYRRNALLDNSLLARYGYNRLYPLLHAINRHYHHRFFPDYQFVFARKPYVNAANFASFAAYADNVQAIITQARATGARPVLITFAYHLPAGYSRQAFLEKKLDYYNPDDYDSRDVYNWGPPDYVREGLARQNDILRDLAGKNDVRLIDVDLAMSGQGRWFGDVCHFNDEGADVFANIVSSVVSP